MDSDEVKRIKDLLAKEQQLRLEAEKKAEKAEKKAKTNKRLRLEEQRLRLEAEKELRNLKLSYLRSRTPAQVYYDFIKDGVSTEFTQFNLPEIEHHKLVSIWDNLIANMDFFNDGKDEKNEVHILIKIGIENIIKNLELNGIKYHYEARLQNPCFTPDFSLTSSVIAAPAWTDCLAFVECKSTNIEISQGAGQAISYLAHLLVPDSGEIIADREMLFSVATNGRNIQFFAFKKEEGEFKKYYSPSIDLFDKNKTRGNPSKGFELLCRFMAFLASSSISTNSLLIDGIRYNILKTYQKTGPIIVGQIDLGGEERICVAKYPVKNNKYGTHLIYQEALVYNMLKESPVKTLKLSSKSNFKQLIFKEVGKGDLRSWGYELLYLNENFDEKSIDINIISMKYNKIIGCFIEVFDQLKMLHDFGYTHCDVRPANIIILEGDKPCLIDLVTVTKHGVLLGGLQGTDIYMSDELLRCKAPYSYKRKYDLESLVYSILDCSDKHYSKKFLSSVELDNYVTDLTMEEEYANKRKDKLEKLREIPDTNHFLYPKLVELFFKLYDKLNTIIDDVNEEDYIQLKAIFQSFLQ